MKDILLSRSIINESWYNKSHAFVVYTHILIMIVYEYGITHEPFKMATSIHRFMYSCGISKKKLLESLELLKLHGLIDYNIDGKEIVVTIFENPDLFVLSDTDDKTTIGYK